MAYFFRKPYVPVAERKRKAALQAAKLAKKGEAVSPVVIEGRSIARTFWGKSWCENLERYSDYANRLPRGRTYVRNGSVIDLRIARGEIAALVSGSAIYRVNIVVVPALQTLWKALCEDCAGSIDSLVELLQGRFSKAVMERVCLPEMGLFPAPRDIKLSCSCPDGARMCKHVAAVLYGIGARLDQSPELLFTLRDVDHSELVSRAGEGAALAKKPVSSRRVMDGGDLGAIFGLDMAASEESEAAPVKAPAKKKASAKKNAAPDAKTEASPDRNAKNGSTAKKARIAPAPKQSAKDKPATGAAPAKRSSTASAGRGKAAAKTVAPVAPAKRKSGARTTAANAAKPRTPPAGKQTNPPANKSRTS